MQLATSKHSNTLNSSTSRSQRVNVTRGMEMGVGSHSLFKLASVHRLDIQIYDSYGCRKCVYYIFCCRSYSWGELRVGPQRLPVRLLSTQE